MGNIPENPFITGLQNPCGMEMLRPLARSNEVLEMDGYAIVRLEADETAEKEGVLQQFNSYIHKAMHELSFVQEREGYFRLLCSGQACAVSAGIIEFGEFLQSTGYAVTGLHSMETLDGENSTEVSFAKAGREAHVMLSTVLVY